MKPSCTACLLALTVSLLASAASGNDVYRKALIKNRAATGFDNSGTAIYNYQVIDEYSDDLTDEEKGNFDLQGEFSNVREVHNFIEVNKGVKDAEEVRLGVVKTHEGNRVREIENNVHMQGGIDVSETEMVIGGVEITGGTVKKVRSSVTIKGDINAK